MKKVMLVASVLAAMAFSTPAAAECYSDGIRVGTVQKFSKKGYIAKSWEGELVMEGTKGTAKSITNVWKFSTLDQSVASVIEDAAMSGKPVSLKYCQLSPLTPNMETDTDYRVVKAVIRQ